MVGLAAGGAAFVAVAFVTVDTFAFVFAEFVDADAEFVGAATATFAAEVFVAFAGAAG